MRITSAPNFVLRLHLYRCGWFDRADANRYTGGGGYQRPDAYRHEHPVAWTIPNANTDAIANKYPAPKHDSHANRYADPVWQFARVSNHAPRISAGRRVCAGGY